MRKIIVNSTPLIALAKANKLEILKGLYEHIIIPEAVYREITEKDDVAAQRIEAAREWIEVSALPNRYYSYSEFTFVWDEDKNAKNIKKHGISFAIAARVFEDELRLEYPDPEHSQDEERWRTIGLVHDVLTVVYCDRENRETGNTDIRIISARLATNLERNAYNNNIIGRY